MARHRGEHGVEVAKTLRSGRDRRLADRKRSGRPKTFTSSVVAEVTAAACELPATRKLPFSRFSSADIAKEVVSSGVVDAISPASVRRILKDAVIRPWRYRS